MVVRLESPAVLTQLDQQLLRFARTRGHTPARERAAALFSKTGEHAACWLALNNACADFFQELRRGICTHLEIETYTFDVLPPDYLA